MLNALKAQGTTADMVQIGNEINTGILWPEGSTDNWSQLAGLLNSGASAAKAVSSSTKVALHLAHGGDNSLYRWWFDNARAQGVNHYVIALSFYGYWHGALSDLQADLDDISARYAKPVLVVETAYPFRIDSEHSHENIIDLEGELVSGYPATTAGQAAWLRDVMNVVEAVPNGRGLGVVYWEPTWTAVPGNGWDRPTRPPATAGRIRPCSTTATGCSPRRTGSATGSPGPVPPEPYAARAAAAPATVWPVPRWPAPTRAGRAPDAPAAAPRTPRSASRTSRRPSARSPATVARATPRSSSACSRRTGHGRRRHRPGRMATGRPRAGFDGCPHRRPAPAGPRPVTARADSYPFGRHPVRPDGAVTPPDWPPNAAQPVRHRAEEGDTWPYPSPSCCFC